PVVLAEYEDRRIDLDHPDAAFVATRLHGRIALRRDLDGGYVLNPRQFVGLVTLPSGRSLVCRPKVPARNLFAMIGAALDLPDLFHDAPVGVDRVEDVIELIIDRFASLMEERVDRGLYRAYVETEENLAMVRGRIVAAEDLRRNHVLRHRTWCRFAEYSWDVPENRVLRQVARLLAGWGLSACLRHRLLRLAAALEEISPGRYVAADLDRWAYHRLNEDYRPLHRLCQLFLEGASLAEAAGAFDISSFLIDMNHLFEAFVTRTLREHAPTGTTVRPQAHISLDQAGTVAMRPDIVVRHTDRMALVADCKYKRLDIGQHRHHDLYQLVAYCTALGIDQGLLVYPRHLAPIDDVVAVRNATIAIHETTIDLSVPHNHLPAECARLAQIAFALATPAPPVGALPRPA
ncbi:MAG: hypothetical protein H0W06_00485, partial [Chloroflexia bacterium]|nr:hypothetical protein [Chloroflexia bacterium]